MTYEEEIEWLESHSSAYEAEEDSEETSDSDVYCHWCGKDFPDCTCGLEMYWGR